MSAPPRRTRRPSHHMSSRGRGPDAIGTVPSSRSVTVASEFCSRGPGGRVRRRRARAVFGGCSRGVYALGMLSALRGVSGQGLITERTLPPSLPLFLLPHSLSPSLSRGPCHLWRMHDAAASGARYLERTTRRPRVRPTAADEQPPPGTTRSERTHPTTLVPPSPTCPHATPSPDCSATAQEISGTDVSQGWYSGSTNSQKDASCCALCDARSVGTTTVPCGAQFGTHFPA